MKHFQIQEFVTRESYIARGEKSIELMDSRIIAVAELLRDLIDKPCIINNWHLNGQYHESGLRSMDTATGAKWSQHKYGRAIDVKVIGMKSEEVRQFIRLHWQEFKAVGLTTIEKDTNGWVHLDCRYTGLDGLLEVPFK
jgi:hypothetical protein